MIQNRVALLGLLVTVAGFTLLLSVPAAEASCINNYAQVWEDIYNINNQGSRSLVNAGNFGSAFDCDNDNDGIQDPGCKLCHGRSTAEWNAYGDEINQLAGDFNNIVDRIKNVENNPSININSSTSYLGEINANAQPGWTTGANNSVFDSSGMEIVNTVDPTTITPPVALPLDPACDFTVSNTELVFGNVTTNTTEMLSTTVTNNGSADCTIATSVTSTTGQFTLATASPVTVTANGGTATVSVDFAPVALGADSGTLNLSSDDPNNPQNEDVALTGNGVDTQCDFTVSDTVLAFTDVTTGTTDTLSTTLTNNGSADCTIATNLTSATGQFTLATASPVTVTANGGTATVSVDFAPVAVGADSGTLNLSSDDPNNPQNEDVALTGNGVAQAQCNFAKSDTELAFGDLTTGTTATLSTTVTNNGEEACIIDATVASGTGQFTLASGTPVNVAPGTSAPVSVEFAPVAVGADSGTLNLNSNDPNNPQNENVALTGNGVEPPPPDACNFTATPPSQPFLAFGDVTVNTTSTLATTVTNKGSTACTIIASVASGSGRFTLVSDSPINVAAGGSASVSVDFAPVITGADSGTLNLTSDAANNPQSINVSLTANGVAPATTSSDLTSSPGGAGALGWWWLIMLTPLFLLQRRFR